MTFVNYFADDTRTSPINLAVARAVLGGYLIWKTVWYDWQLLYDAPYVVVDKFSFYLPPEPWILVVEQWLLILALGAFVLGYRLGTTSFVAALLLSHLAAVRYTHNNSGGTTALFIAAYFLVFFGLYRGQDELSLDGIRRLRAVSMERINAVLTSGPARRFPATALKWNLLVLAVIYFGAGFQKVIAHGGLGFATAENLSRIIVFRHAVQHQAFDVGRWLVEYPMLVGASAAGTLVLELGLLPAVLVGVTVTPFLLGLVGMTTAIALAMGILFGDVFVFVALFVAWDTVYERLVATDREIALVYDDHCSLCVRCLYPFALLDVTDSVTFIPASAASPEEGARDDIDIDEAMVVFDGDRAYPGYAAFRELFRQFRVFLPVVWVMGLAPIARIGEQVYGYVAANRSRHFACRIEGERDVDFE